MLYEKVLNIFLELKEQLVFQERRNFFNQKKDKHLIQSIEIINCIIEKTNKFEFSYKDLAEVITITVKIVGLLEVTDETKDLLKSLNKYKVTLEKQYFELFKE